MEEHCEVPDLLDIFTKIVCDRKNYCFLCLRTGDERRLVKPDCLKKFLAAMKLTTNGNVQYVCHICERQASNALKLFRAAVFASSLSLILTELCKRNIRSNQLMLDPKYFKRVLNKVQLSKNLTPATINDELRQIRNNNFLSETDTLVMDNKQIYEAAPTVVAITTGQADGNNSEALHQAIIQCPIEPIVQHLPQRCSTPSILPDRDVSQEDIMQNCIPSQEAYVILDDDDDPLRPTHTPTPSITKDILTTTSNPSFNQNLMTSVASLNDKFVITSDPPNIVKFEDLLTQQTKQTNFLLHPIFLAEDGTLSVPSLSAIIMNQTIFFQDSTKQIRYSRPLQVNMDIVKQSLNSNQEVFLQNCNKFELPSGNSNFVNLLVDKGCQSEFPYPRKRKKMENIMCVNKSAGSSSNSVCSRIKEVTISDISSDMDEMRPRKGGDVKTDWEDKIPMDVISFVDAVDPNAHSVLLGAMTSPCAGLRVGDVRSLAGGGDVIDLC